MVKGLSSEVRATQMEMPLCFFLALESFFGITAPCLSFPTCAMLSGWGFSEV